MDLEREVFGNAIRSWSIAGSITVAVWVVLSVIKVFAARRLTALSERTATELDDVAAEVVRKIRWYLILAIALRAGSVALTLPDGISRGIRQFLAIAVLLQLAVWGNAIIGYWIRRWGQKRGGTNGGSTLGAINALAKAVLWIVIGILALRNVLDYDISALLTGLGIGGIAIALAVQNILGDLFAALSIVLDKPFEVGDAIAVDTFVGTVEHVGLKTTRVRAVSGEQVIFSNADLLRSRVRNLKRLQERRALQVIGVTYSTTADVIAEIPALLRRVVEAQPQTRFDRAHFVGFGESALNFELVYFVRSPEYLVFMDTQHAVNLGILREFSGRGIDFAFPTRTIVNVGPAPQKGADAEAGAGKATDPEGA
jgi:small-conductance mechanosensitive channel